MTDPGGRANRGGPGHPDGLGPINTRGMPAGLGQHGPGPARRQGQPGGVGHPGGGPGLGPGPGPGRAGPVGQFGGPVDPGGVRAANAQGLPGGVGLPGGPGQEGAQGQAGGPGRPVPRPAARRGPTACGSPAPLSNPAEGDPIEAESYRILRSRIDLSHLPPFSRAVIERVIHASADFDYATDLVCDEAALAAGAAALAAGAPVVADVAMVAAAITSRPVICRIGESLTTRLARRSGITRAAAGVRLAFGEAGAGAVWVIGCAPTAVAEILSRDVQPALVIGLPVGFVGAAEVKDALRASGLPALTNKSEKGGSAVAAAALNALLRSIPPRPSPTTEGGQGRGGRKRGPAAGT